MTTYSVEDVFGGAVPAPSSKTGNRYTLDEVLGGGKPSDVPQPSPSPRRSMDKEIRELNQRMAQTQLKKRAIDAVEIPLKVAREGVSTADMLASLPGMAVGEFTYLTNRLGHTLSGRGPETIKQDRAYADQVEAQLSNPLQQAAAAIMPPKQPLPPTGVDTVMQKLTGIMQKAGAATEKHVGMPKEDVTFLINAAMVGLGARGAMRSVSPKPRVLPKLEVPETPEPTEPGAKATQALEEAQKLPEAPKGKTRLVEGQVIGEQPAEPKRIFTKEEILGKSHLDSALDKLGRNAAFDMTAEEKIALRERMAQPDRIQVPRGQSGKVDSKLLANLALVGGGAAAGWALSDDDKVTGLVLGGLAGVAAANTSIPKMREAVKAFRTPDNRVRITDAGDAHEATFTKAMMQLSAQQQRLLDLVPDAGRRAAISRWLEDPKSETLSPKEMKAAKIAREYWDTIGGEALDAGTLKAMRENYVTHVYDFGGADKGLLAKLMNAPEGQGMSPKSPFAKQRSYATLAEAKAAGLKPKTEDVAELMGYYGQSMGRAIANANLIRDLKTRSLPNGSLLIQSIDKAPRDYVNIDHPQLRGMAVHPDIAPSVQFLFDQKTLPGVLRGMEIANIASKRMKVSFSLFHATALLQGYAGAGGKLGKIPGILSGKDALLQDLRQGGLSPEIDLAVKSGLKFSIPRVNIAGDLESGTFYEMLKSTQQYMDNAIPGSGKVVKGFADVNHAVDKFMWERLHTGLKLNLFLDKFQELKENNTRAVEAGKAKPLSDAELGKMAASFSNDVLGGLNWRMIAEGVKSRFGRDLALKTFSPTGQRALRLAFFAPDWLMSTTRGLTQTVGRGTGFKGALKPQTLADLHRSYQLRSAMYYVILADGIQYSRTGKHIWENEDWTKVQLGNGRYMRLAKHFTDPYELGQHPDKILGKLGAPAQVLLGEAKSAEKGEGLSVKPLFEQYAPFSLNKGKPSLSSTLGVPIYGKTPEEREREKEERRRKAESPAAERVREKKREKKERGE